MANKILAKLGSFISNSRHILNISYKPKQDEFNRSAKIILLGIILIGVIGFVISLIIQYISGTAI